MSTKTHIPVEFLRPRPAFPNTFPITNPTPLNPVGSSMIGIKPTTAIFQNVPFRQTKSEIIEPEQMGRAPPSYVHRVVAKPGSYCTSPFDVGNPVRRTTVKEENAEEVVYRVKVKAEPEVACIPPPEMGNPLTVKDENARGEKRRYVNRVGAGKGVPYVPPSDVGNLGKGSTTPDGIARVERLRCQVAKGKEGFFIPPSGVGNCLAKGSSIGVGECFVKSSSTGVGNPARGSTAGVVNTPASTSIGNLLKSTAGVGNPAKGITTGVENGLVRGSSTGVGNPAKGSTAGVVNTLVKGSPTGVGDPVRGSTAGVANSPVKGGSTSIGNPFLKSIAGVGNPAKGITTGVENNLVKGNSTGAGYPAKGTTAGVVNTLMKGSPIGVGNSVRGSIADVANTPAKGGSTGVRNSAKGITSGVENNLVRGSSTGVGNPAKGIAGVRNTLVNGDTTGVGNPLKDTTTGSRNHLVNGSSAGVDNPAKGSSTGVRNPVNGMTNPVRNNLVKGISPTGVESPAKGITAGAGNPAKSTTTDVGNPVKGTPTRDGIVRQERTEGVDPIKGKAQERAIDKILAHTKGRDVSFKVLWKDGDVTWLPYEKVKDPEAISAYRKALILSRSASRPSTSKNGSELVVDQNTAAVTVNAGKPAELGNGNNSGYDSKGHIKNGSELVVDQSRTAVTVNAVKPAELGNGNNSGNSKGHIKNGSELVVDQSTTAATVNAVKPAELGNGNNTGKDSKGHIARETGTKPTQERTVPTLQDDDIMPTLTYREFNFIISRMIVSYKAGMEAKERELMDLDKRNAMHKSQVLEPEGPGHGPPPMAPRAMRTQNFEQSGYVQQNCRRAPSFREGGNGGSSLWDRIGSRVGEAQFGTRYHPYQGTRLSKNQRKYLNREYRRREAGFIDEATSENQASSMEI